MQAPIELGTVIQNRYRILSILGQGGFGRTYLAEDQNRFNELCAIKELIPPSAGDYALEKSKELFQREAQVLYQIQHPQVPQFQATFAQDGRFFIVQDYVNGKTYREQLEQLRSQGYVFSEAEIQELIAKLLPTLTYLHSKGIIHRDISPENIILRERDQMPVLIDFGVVKELATKIQAPASSHQATTVGKVGFAPSEQMQTGKAFPNSDLYALAVTAIVLLTGREPQELLDERTMQWHWQRWASVSSSFANMLNRMLSYAPGDRYQSAAEVQQVMQSLNSAAAIQPPTVPPPSPISQPVAPSPQNQSEVATPVNSEYVPTVAVGRRGGSPPTHHNGPNTVHNEPSIPRQSSVWDDPFAVISVGIGLMIIAGIGTWAAFNALNRNGPTPTPTPTGTVTLSPAPSNTPTPQPTPTTFSQTLELTPGQPAIRSATLKANETINFTFSGSQGQLLKAEIQGEGVLMSVIGPNGEAIDQRARRVRFWEGELSQDGAYSLELGVVQGLEQGDFTLEATIENPIPEPSPSPEPSPDPEPSPSPEPTEPPPPVPSPSPKPPQPAPEIKTQRVLIPQGQTSTTIQGRSSPQQTQRYLIRANAGQILEVGVSGGAKISLLLPDGSPVTNATGIKRRSLELPTSGDYIVDVISREATDFQLDVDVK